MVTSAPSKIKLFKWLGNSFPCPYNDTSTCASHVLNLNKEKRYPRYHESFTVAKYLLESAVKYNVLSP